MVFSAFVYFCERALFRDHGSDELCVFFTASGEEQIKETLSHGQIYI